MNKVASRNSKHQSEGNPMFSGGEQVFDFYGTNDTAMLVKTRGGNEISMTNSIAQDYDNSDPDGDGWGQGRWFNSSADTNELPELSAVGFGTFSRELLAAQHRNQSKRPTGP